MGTMVTNASSTGATRFLRFKELPESLRERIWTQAASVPRTVEIHETYGTFFSNGTVEYDTSIGSRTRPPALMQVCAEARRVALKIFIPAYEDAHSNRARNRPIYINPLTDITFRGLCSRPFKLLGPNHTKDVRPVAATRTLAVNSRILFNLPSVTHNDQSIIEQIMECANAGLAVLIFVVGNGQDQAEFELEEIDFSGVIMRDVLFRVKTLSKILEIRHLFAREGAKPPVIKVMKVKSRREPIISFPQFSRLPQELQNEVWSYVSETRQLICIERSAGLHGVQDRIWPRCQPALLSVCQASRSIAMKKLTLIPWTSDAKPGYYNKSLDVVVMPKFNRIAIDFEGWEIKYVGLPLQGSMDRDHVFLYRIEGIKKVFLVVGECLPNAEITLVPFTGLYEIGKNGKPMFSDLYYYAQGKIYARQKQLKEAAARFEASEERSAELGEPRAPKWDAPAVKAAKVVAVPRVASPYSYDFRKP